jgi:hypothetical protein
MLLMSLANAEHALSDLKRMLIMRLKYKITNMRPEHEKNQFYFIVPKSSTHRGLNCVKNSATNISCLGPFNSEAFIRETFPLNNIWRACGTFMSLMN